MKFKEVAIDMTVKSLITGKTYVVVDIDHDECKIGKKNILIDDGHIDGWVCAEDLEIAE